MNVHDSEKIAGIMHAEGHTETDTYEDADLVVFNTCSIRQKAEQKFLSELGRLKILKRTRPELKVAVAGCIAQQMGEQLFKRVSGAVDYILGPQNLHALPGLMRSQKGIAVQDNPNVALIELPATRKDRARAWVAIMYGCNNFCSYCIVPYTRGRERSRPSRSIIDEVTRLAQDGCVEITLLGQNVNSYKSDMTFPELLGALNAVEGIKRIRFVTSHPRDLSDELIDAIAALDKVCNNLHLPVQSGSTRILELMNRGYSVEQYLDKVARLKARIPGITLTTDIISGFPTETDDDHQATLKVVREVKYDGIFAFKYSPRPGTMAATMEGHLSEEVQSPRLNEILAVQEALTLQGNQQMVGARFEVLVEGPSETDASILTGRTDTNKVTNFPGDPDLVGSLVMVEVTKARRHSLDAKIMP